MEEGGEPGIDPRGPAVDPAGGVDDAAQRLFDGELRGGEETVLLGGEVLVEGVARDPGAAHDVGHGDRAIALLDGLLGEGGDDASALVLGDELTRQRCLPGGILDRLGDTFSHGTQATQQMKQFQAGRIGDIPLQYRSPDNLFP